MIPLSGSDEEAEVMVDINTTPLVDVLLVLLVMLIITIPVQLHAVNLDMPSANTPAPPVPPEIVRIDVLPGGVFQWNGEIVPERLELESRLQKAAAQSTPPEIHLRPDRRARYDSVAAVLASAQRQGLAKIGLIGSEQFAP